MSLFNRLFKSQPTQGPLESFLSGLTTAEIRALSMKASDRDTKVATAISLLALSVVYRFSSGLVGTTRPLWPDDRAAAMLAAGFDVIAFETAAFAHYTLLAPFLEDMDQDDEEDSGEDSTSLWCEPLRLSQDSSSRRPQPSTSRISSS